MSNIVWKSPTPSSGFDRGVSVQLNPRREIVLKFEFEDASDEMRSGELVFRDVVHYRTTFVDALRADVILETYDQVVDEGISPELLEIEAAMRANGRNTEVRHYRVCFDDGPYFEFFAARFEAFIS